MRKIILIILALLVGACDNYTPCVVNIKHKNGALNDKYIVSCPSDIHGYGESFNIHTIDGTWHEVKIDRQTIITITYLDSNKVNTNETVY